MCVMLVVEDNAIFRKVLADTLKAGFPNSAVLEAANGAEAMVRFDDSRPDIIFLDMKLPDTNGLHLAKRMRTSHAAANILMLTSYDIPEYSIAARANGVNHFLVKGAVSSNEIMQIVGSIITEGQYAA